MARSAADPVWTTVKMKVVAVRRVVVRAQNCPETLAGAVTHLAQALVHRAVVEGLEGRDGGELEQDDPARRPVAFVHRVRTAARQVKYPRN